ncbi:hypothetical protein DesyoDRAFT_4753 [Desulfosporosinus youngiae DSM 17734]|uniref:Uncharacterized protein n=1 Tax=Desulfosporosinus youngiae DSM 17734 TaxID=768710 RepID=H5XYZ1_9FIRM|nr:hypothetical protein DesyoDRAFT_4753 [Desulfosporosinus youngiae DSM 17734]
MPDLIRQPWKLPGKRSTKFYKIFLLFYLTVHFPRHIIVKINTFDVMTRKKFANSLYQRVRAGGSRTGAVNGAALSIGNEGDPMGSNRVEPREQTLVPVA